MSYKNKTKEEVLKEVWGYDEFRHGQVDIIDSILENKPTLGIMPTGGGKSVCFQLPAIMKDGITIVISPLISLMNDQVKEITALNIPGAALHSNLSYQDKKEILRQVENDELKLLYVSPERAISLLSEMKSKNINISQIAFDEAHCLSQWGNDFRPEYKRVANAITQDNHNIIALTATADPRTQNDLQTILVIPDSNVHISGFGRENLWYGSESKKGDGLDQVKNLLKENSSGSKIIYCNTTKDVDKLTSQLQKSGFKARSYHAKLDISDKEKTFDSFINDETDIVVATTAFGMGINKREVDLVILYDTPASIEDAYQQLGRAGRAGQEAKCICLYDKGQTINSASYYKSTGETEDKTKKRFETLILMSSGKCIETGFLKYFGEIPDTDDCGKCSACDAAEIEQDFEYNPNEFSRHLMELIDDGVKMNLAIDILSGSKTGEANDYREDYRFGLYKLKTITESKEYAKSLGQDLIIHQYLLQEPYPDMPQAYKLIISKKGREFLNNNDIEIKGHIVPELGNKASKIKATKPKRGTRRTNTYNSYKKPYENTYKAPITPRVTKPVEKRKRDENIYNLLIEKRDEIASDSNLKSTEYWRILSNMNIHNIAMTLPKNKDEILGIDGINFSKIQYSDWIIDICNNDPEIENDLGR